MALFKKSETVNANSEIANNRAKEETTNMKNATWVWVDGYKGTDQNISCRGFKFDVGQKYVHTGDIKMCKNGFHLCLEIVDVMHYYDYDFSNRYFKVRALVNEEELKHYGEVHFANYEYKRADKLVAKEIILVEEVTHSQLMFEHIKGRFPLIETTDELKSITNYEDFEKCKAVRKLLENRSETFAMLLYGLAKRKGDSAIYDIINLSRALACEAVSPDMSAYLLLESLK